MKTTESGFGLFNVSGSGALLRWHNFKEFQRTRHDDPVFFFLFFFLLLPSQPILYTE